MCCKKILHDKVLLRPINNSETLTTDLFVHMSAKRDLAIKGLKAKSANIDSFEQYDTRLYLYPLVKPEDFDSKSDEEKEQIEKQLMCDFVYNKSARIAKRFNEVRLDNKEYYIYSVKVIHKYTFYKDTAQSSDYAVYVKNGISSRYVNLIGQVNKDGRVKCYVR